MQFTFTLILAALSATTFAQPANSPLGDLSNVNLGNLGSGNQATPAPTIQQTPAATPASTPPPARVFRRVRTFQKKASSTPLSIETPAPTSVKAPLKNVRDQIST
jgi:hypothetical protein